MSFIFCESFKEKNLKNQSNISSRATEDHTLGGLHIEEVRQNLKHHRM